MAKRRNVSGSVLRNAVPQPRDIAEFIAPRTVNEGLTIANIFGDAAEMTPFAGAVPYAERKLGLRDYSDEDVLLAAILGFPILGKFKNLKEALGDASWANAKSTWKNNRPTARKLYADPNVMQHRGSREGGLSTRGRARRTYDEVTPVDIPAGPYQVTNNGSLVQNRGGTATNTNTVRTTGGHTPLKGAEAWQGDMYPPGRSLRKDDMYGPFQWEDAYSRKLNDVIDKNELKWEYLINQTRPITSGRFVGTELPKESAIETALKQGRPDIAERIAIDDKPRVPVNTGEFKSIGSQHRHSKLSNEEFKDIGNRQVEKEIREAFATLPEDPDIRFRFAEYYGVPDLYQSWINDPLPWTKYKNDTQRLRYFRESSNRSRDRQYGRNIQR